MFECLVFWLWMIGCWGWWCPADVGCIVVDTVVVCVGVVAVDIYAVGI